MDTHSRASEYISYIAYFYTDEAIVLCVSDEVWKCRYYCERIRRLHPKQYEIREVLLDESSRYALFEDFILEEFTDDYLFLTNQDIVYLVKEVDQSIDQMESLIGQLDWYMDLIRGCTELRSGLSGMLHAEGIVRSNLASIATIHRLCDQIYKKSVVISGNIYEYLNCMKTVRYDRELNDMYTWKLYDEKS